MWNLRKAHSFQVGISLWALVDLLQPASYPYTSWLPGKENSLEMTHAPCTHVYNSEGQESATLTWTQKARRRKDIRDHLVQTRLLNTDEAP